MFAHNVDIASSNGVPIFSKVNVSGGTWKIRQGYTLPTGLSLDATTGKIYGKPQTSGETEISYEYVASGYNTNISDIFFIRVDLSHKITFVGTSKERARTNDLSVNILSLSNEQFNFTSFINYL
jgi:hypothetical protein